MKVTSPADSELIHVSLVGVSTDSAEELSPVLNAVVQAFLEEIVDKERLEKVAVLDTLRKRYKRNFNEVQEKTDAVQTLAEHLGSIASGEVKAELELQRFRCRRLYRQLDQLEQRLLDLRLEMVAVGARNDDEAKKQTEVLSAQSEFLVENIAKLNQSIESRIERYRELISSSGELEARMHELSGIRRMTQQVHGQIQALEIEIDAPSPVKIIQSAR